MNTHTHARTDTDTDADNDDLPVGRIFSRRETLALFGMSATALLAACTGGGTGSSGGNVAAQSADGATATNPTATAPQAASVSTADTTTTTTTTTSTTAGCVVRPEMTEGPYFVDEKLNRSDIRVEPSDGTTKAGVPLALTFNLSSVGGNACTPLAGATVDVWQCDAAGVYSDVAGAVGKKFLRGQQTTDARGVATFTTIYPGWYTGRAVHIHFKIRTTGTDTQAYEFTSQLFFDDTLTDQVYTHAPYTDRAGTRDTRNAADMIYANGGDQMLLAPTPTDQGYAAAFAVGLDLSDTAVGKADGNTMGGGGGRPRWPRRSRWPAPRWDAARRRAEGIGDLTPGPSPCLRVGRGEGVRFFTLVLRATCYVLRARGGAGGAKRCRLPHQVQRFLGGD